jgi:hypothetical protein
MACAMGSDCELELLLRAYSEKPDRVLRRLKKTSSAAAIYTAIAYSGHRWEELSLLRARALLLHHAASACNVSPKSAPLPSRLADFLVARLGSEDEGNDSVRSDQARAALPRMSGLPEYAGESRNPTGEKDHESQRAFFTIDVIGIDVDVRKYLQSGAACFTCGNQIPSLDALTEALTNAFIVTDGAIIDIVGDYLSCFTHSSFCNSVQNILAQPHVTSAHVVATSHLVGLYCRAHLTRSVPWTVIVNDEVVSQLFLNRMEYSTPSEAVDSVSSAPSETGFGALCARVISLSFIRHCLVQGRQPGATMRGDGCDDVAQALDHLLTRLAWLLTRPGLAEIISRNLRSIWMNTYNDLLILHDASKPPSVETARQADENGVAITICECGIWQHSEHIACNAMKPCCSSPNRTRHLYPPPDRWVAWELHASLLNLRTNGSGEQIPDPSDAPDPSKKHTLSSRPETSTEHPDALLHFISKQWSMLPVSQLNVFQAVLNGFSRAKKCGTWSRLQTSRITVPQRVRFIAHSASPFRSFSDFSACLDFALVFFAQHQRKTNAKAPEPCCNWRPAAPVTSNQYIDMNQDEDAAFYQKAVLLALSCLAAPRPSDGTNPHVLDCSMESRLEVLRRCELMLRCLVSPGDQCSYSRDVLQPVASVAALACHVPATVDVRDKISSSLIRRRFPRAWGLVMLARRGNSSQR